MNSFDEPTLQSSGFKNKRPSRLSIAVTVRPDVDRPGIVTRRRENLLLSDESVAPPAEALDEVADAFKRAGVEVSGKGEKSLTIRCTAREARQLFGSALEERPATYLGKDVTLPYRPEDRPMLRSADHLSSMIESAYVQWPHIYMNDRFASPPEASPTSPKAAAEYFSVDEVVTLLGGDRAHRDGVTGQGVRAMMIDSGFAHGHAYFRERGYNVSTVLAPGASHRDRDGNGHGTGESANLLAIAPGVTFIGVKLDNEDDPNLGASVLEGLQEAQDHQPDLISVSLGFDLMDRDTGTVFNTLPGGLVALEAEIRAMVAAGVVIIFSAGNGHIAFPGMMPEVLSAGGVHIDVNGRMLASDYASAFTSLIYAGRNVPDVCGLVGMRPNAASIMLPIPVGCEIDVKNSAFDGTTRRDGWARFSGTSAAAPQLGGIVALMLQENPALTPAEVKATLRRTALDVVNGSSSPGAGARPAGPGIDNATGAGLANAAAAVAQA